MALRLIEGFETKQVSSTKLDRVYTVSGAVIGTATGRKGGTALTASSLSLTSGPLVSSDENVWIVGFAVRKLNAGSTLGANATAGLQLRNADGEQCSLVMAASGDSFVMQLKRGATVIATTTRAWPSGSNRLAWQYFQLKVTVRDGTDGAYELRSYDHDNAMTVQFSGTGVNLANQAADGADRVRISWVSDGGGSIQIDDVVVMDGTGSANNDFLSKPVKVFGLLPDGDGNQSDWDPSSGSAHWSLVDDGATSTSDTDRVTSLTPGDVDLYTYANLSGVLSGATVVGVQVASTVAMVSSGSRTIRVRARSGTDEAFGSSVVISDLVLRTALQIFEENPTGTPAAWTPATIDSVQLGVEVVS